MIGSYDSATTIFRHQGGILRMAEALRAGIDRSTLYGMLRAGTIERLSRGLYRLSDLPSLAQPDLVTVAARAPEAVICSISALAFHELTTQIPHGVDIAIRRGARPPSIEYPPIHVHWMSPAAFEVGIETHDSDGQKLRVYGADKAVVDAFKYRNKTGEDVAIEALRSWFERGNRDLRQILTIAGICRVQNVMLPYLKALA